MGNHVDGSDPPPLFVSVPVGNLIHAVVGGLWAGQEYPSPVMIRFLGVVRSSLSRDLLEKLASGRDVFTFELGVIGKVLGLRQS